MNLKEIFKRRSEQIFQRLKDDPNRYKNEGWYEGNGIELRKSMIQYLGDYISKFRTFGWNHGNNVCLHFFFSFLSFLSSFVKMDSQLNLGICNSNDSRDK